MPVEGAKPADDLMPLQPQSTEPQAQDVGQYEQNPESTQEPAEAISEQTLSLDTLSELNSLNGQ